VRFELLATLTVNYKFREISEVSAASVFRVYETLSGKNLEV